MTIAFDADVLIYAAAEGHTFDNDLTVDQLACLGITLVTTIDCH